MYARFMHQTLTNLTVPTYNLHSVVSKVEQNCYNCIVKWRQRHYYSSHVTIRPI